MLAVSGRSWGLCWRSCSRSWSLCWRSCSRSWPLLAVLGRTWGLCWRSWAALGTNVGGLRPLLGPLLAVLGRSWGLCWRSWAALGAYVGCPGPSWAEKWPWLEREGLRERDLGPKSWRGGSGRKVALARAGRQSAARSPPRLPRAARPTALIYQLIDMCCSLL